jgi:ABC-type sugar transport system ATPase subunit
MTHSDTPLIEMRGIEKNFGRVVALDGVDLALREGEILGLLGDNGSGKSTLIKVLVGVHQADAGETYLHGDRVDIDSPRTARQLGIETVFQDLALINELSVAANIFLDRYPKRDIAGIIPRIDWPKMNRRAEAILSERLNIDIDVRDKVEFFSGGERQAVAVGRALVTDPDVIIMDEPTSALSAESADRVRTLIRELNDQGVSIIIITHNLEEVFDLTDRITVLRSGERVGTVSADSVTKNDIVTMMISGTMPSELTAEG